MATTEQRLFAKYNRQVKVRLTNTIELVKKMLLEDPNSIKVSVIQASYLEHLKGLCDLYANRDFERFQRLLANEKAREKAGMKKGCRLVK